MYRWSIALRVNRGMHWPMPLMSNQELKMMQAAIVFGFLGIMAMPVWAEEKQDMMREKSGRHGFKNCRGNEEKSRMSCASSDRNRRGRRGPLFHGLNSRINRREV